MLFDTNPELKGLWHPTLNTMDPAELTAKSVKKVYWVCPTYGHPWEAAIRNVAKGSRCGVCKGFQIYPGFNDLESQLPKIAKRWDYTKNEKSPQEVHFRSHTKYWFICENSHPSFDITPYNADKGKWCPYCSGRKAIPGVNDIFTTHPQAKDIWSKNNTEDPTTLKAQSNRKVLWWCGKHEWIANPYNVLGSGTRCPVCANKIATPETALTATHPDIAAQWHPTKNIRTPNQVTSGHGSQVWWRCPNNPEHVWSTYVYNRTKPEGTSCPQCAYSPDSRGQLDLMDFVQSVLPEGAEVLKTRDILDGREIDIYIPSLRIGIEYNGTYNHSSARYRRERMEAEKTAIAREKGIRLVHVWEHDWRDNRLVVQNQLKSLLGVYSGRKVFARNTTVTPITYSEAALFLDNHHIQGSCAGTYYLGLKHKEEIVAVMVLTYSKKTRDLVLDRYSTSTSVPGGHSKMIKYVERTYSYSNLVTFADLQHSYGDLYKTTGWVLDKEMSPDYRYLYKGKVHHKFGFRLKRFKNDPDLTYDPQLTEPQLAELNNIYRIWDCGKIRFIKPHPDYVV